MVDIPKLDTPPQQIVALLVMAAMWLAGKLFDRSGKKADDQLKPKDGGKDEPTVRELMKQTLTETRDGTAAAVRAENAAVSAAVEAKSAMTTCGNLDKKLDAQAEHVTAEFVTIHKRIDDVRDIAVSAKEIARAAAGTRKSDDALRTAAADTPPAGVPAITEG